MTVFMRSYNFGLRNCHVRGDVIGGRDGVTDVALANGVLSRAVGSEGNCAEFCQSHPGAQERGDTYAARGRGPQRAEQRPR